jgi:pentatricopeptide repeat protein
MVVQAKRDYVLQVRPGMFLHIHRQNTVCLLDLLIPSLLYRARSFTTQPGSSKRATQPMLKNVPPLHSKIRDQILAQTANKPTLPNSEKLHINDALVRVRRAVRDRDIVAALERWQYLQNLRRESSKGDLYHIPESYYKDLTRLVCSHLYGMSSPGELGSEVKTMVEWFAFNTATQYSDSEALAAYLLFHIKQNRPQDAIDLYQTFIKSVGLTTSQPPEPISSEEELFDDDAHHSELEDLGRASVLLAATTAYTMTGSFKSAFDTYRATDIRIDHRCKNKFLKHLKYNPTLHAEVQKYLERLEVADLVARPPSLSKHIMNLSRSDAHTLEGLYARIMDGIRASDHYLAAQPSEVSSTRLVSLTPVGWTSFQTAFIKCERTDLAEKLWSDLSELGVRPGVAMWTGLLDTYADLRDSSRVMNTWRMMQSEGILPAPLSYRAIISGLFNDRKPEQAMKYFGEYQRLFKGHYNGHATAVYNTVIRKLLSLNRIYEVNSLLAEMRLAGPTPDIVSYNTLLAYYAQLNDFKALANVVTTMSAANISGDVVTFSTILTALLRVGTEDAPTAILNLMRKQGIQPNVITCKALIDHQMRAQTEESLQAALLMLDKMEQDASIKPGETIYTSILTGLYRGRWLNRQKADELSRSIVLRMKKRQIRIRQRTYNILISASLESSDPDGYKDALAIFQEMEKQGIPRIHHSTWHLLLTGLMKLGKWDVASEMVSKMYKSGCEPSLSMNELVSKIGRASSIHTK